MMLRSYPTDGVPAVSYLGDPSGSIIGTLVDSTGITLPDFSGPIRLPDDGVTDVFI